MNVVKGYFCYSGSLGFQTLEFAHPNYCTVVTVSILLALFHFFRLFYANGILLQNFNGK